RVIVPRALRFICLGLEMRRCRLCATFALTLPDAVRPKRFFAPLFVFSLGISDPFGMRVDKRRRGMPLGAGARPCRRIAAPYSGAVRGTQAKSGILLSERVVIASRRRSNPARGTALDCFASLAMTAEGLGMRPAAYSASPSSRAKPTF